MTYDEWLERLGLNINHARCEKGLTQAELAERIGCTQAVVSQIECGHGCRLRTLFDISEALGWPLASLVGRNA